MLTGPIPHIGGPIMGPGAITVLLDDVPAACVGDECVCVGPPATIVTGAFTVLMEDRPAARMGDITDHGGAIMFGVPNILLGP